MLHRYDNFIKATVRTYLHSVEDSMLANVWTHYEDCLAEAQIAFLKYVRQSKHNFLSQPQLEYCGRSLRYAMRRYLWSVYNMGGYVGRRVLYDRLSTMSDFEASKEAHPQLEPMSEPYDDTRFDVEQFLSRLSERERKAVFLRMDDNSYKAIARQLQCSESLVRYDISKARAIYFRCKQQATQEVQDAV